MSLKSSKLAVKFGGSSAISCVSFLSRYKKTEMQPLFCGSHPDSRLPLFISIIPKDAFIASSAITTALSIHSILGKGCLSQIIPAIVVILAVLVVNEIFRPFSRHPEPRESMCATGPSTHVYCYAATAMKRSRWTGLPSKKSGVRVIIEEFSDIFGGYIISAAAWSPASRATHC